MYIVGHKCSIGYTRWYVGVNELNGHDIMTLNPQNAHHHATYEQAEQTAKDTGCEIIERTT